MTDITDPTAIQQRKKFLIFVNQLSTSYPPMTFQEYQYADGNHTNWFQQQWNIEEQYISWFTCAVLNNFQFMLRVFKQRDPDAINLFGSIINNDKFNKYFDKHYNFNNYNSPPYTLYEYNTYPKKIKFTWDFNISSLLEDVNRVFQLSNYNTCSSKIIIPNNLLPFMYYKNVTSKLTRSGEYYYFNNVDGFSDENHPDDVYNGDPIIYRLGATNVTADPYVYADYIDLTKIYDIQVRSNSSATPEIIFSVSNNEPIFFSNIDKHFDKSTNSSNTFDTLSLLTSMMGDCLLNS